MASIIVVLLMSVVIGFLATASRMIWSFARDRGMPFYPYISKASRSHLHLLSPNLLNIHLGRTKNFDSHGRDSHGHNHFLPPRAHLHRLLYRL